MFSASARFSSLRVKTGSSRRWRSASVSGVQASGSPSGSDVGTSTPKTALFNPPPGEFVLHFLRLAGGLVFQAHRLLDGRYLRVGKFTRPVVHNLDQRAARHKEIDKVTAERIRRTAQGVQSNPVRGFRLLQSGHGPGGRSQPGSERRGAHAERVADCAKPAA